VSDSFKIKRNVGLASLSCLRARSGQEKTMSTLFPECLRLDGWRVLGLFVPVPNLWATKLPNRDSHLLDFRDQDLRKSQIFRALEAESHASGFFSCVVHFKAQGKRRSIWRSQDVVLWYNSL